MGGIISSIVGAGKLLRTVIAALKDMKDEYAFVHKRVFTPATLPQPPTVSKETPPFWLLDPPFPDLVDMQSDKLVPEADIVIIGSGIAAAATARSALHEAQHQVSQQELRRRHQQYQPKADSSDGVEEEDAVLPRVVVLEARRDLQRCDGSERGTHQSSPSELLGRLLRRGVKPERAAELVRFQLRHLPMLLEMCEPHKGSSVSEVAECREVETVDFYVGGSKGHFEKAKGEVEDLRRLLPEVEVKIWEDREAKEEFSSSAAVVGALSYKAGALWPYRLVTAVWSDLLDTFPDNLLIETSTPVTSITTYSPSSSDYSDYSPHHPYMVHTPRGRIRARHVVHATNGYATHLVPGLVGKMIGLKAHMSCQNPETSFSPGKDGGGRSWSFLYGGGAGYDYVTQRPDKMVESALPLRGDGTEPVPRSGELMVGGGFSRSARKGSDMVGLYDDGEMDGLTVAHISGIMSAVFDARESDNLDLRHVWSGVICATGDLLPLVGRLDERVTKRKVVRAGSGGGWGKKAAGKKTKDEAANGDGDKDRPGEWIAAGFNGDGMVWAWLCGTALGIMLTTTSNSSSGRGDQEEEADVDDDVQLGIAGRPKGKLEDWFPEELYASYERIKKMNVMDLADEIL